MRCLEKNPDARYQNAHEMLADLRGERSTAGAGGLASTRTISWTVPVLSRKGWLIAASIAAIVVIAAATPATRKLILGEATTSQAAAQPAAQEPIRLAVLPFTVASEVPTLTYAAAGIEEALAAKLFQVKNVNVTSASSVQRVVRAKLATDQIGRELGAAFLVSGMVQGNEKELRVTVHLEDTARHQRVWFKEYSGLAADLLTIQDNIFRDLVPHLELTLTTDEQSATLKNPTASIEAYEWYLRGRTAMRNDQDLKNVEAAIGFYEEARKRDPNFALAYAGIADSAIRMYRSKKDPKWAEQALAAAHQAQALDDSLVEVHLSLGNVYQETGKTTQAIVEFRRATAMAPSSDDAYRRLGAAYSVSGNLNEAIEAFEKAVEINRYHWVNSARLGVAHAMLANYDESIKAFERVTELAPDNVNGWNDLGAAYLQAGRPSQAIPAFQRALKLEEIPDTYTNLAIANAQAGRFTEAVPLFEKAVELEPTALFVGNLADGYRWANQPEKASATYDRAIALALKHLQVNPRDAITKASLALYYAKKGEGSRARRLMNEARDIDNTNVDLIYNEAILCALQNDVACSITNLEQALKEGYTIPLIESDPDLRSVRSDQRYQALKRASSSSPQ
jgi:tetratricopeptide (TPR) repeat protein/TolB-like protein